MAFWNPFKDSNEEIARQRKEESDMTLSAQVLGNPGQLADEQMQAERREMLVQLTQWQQDRSPVMQRLFLTLCGMQIDKDSNTIEKVKWNEGVVKPYGAKKIVDFIESLDHNVMLANWEQSMIIRTLRDSIAHPLKRFLFQNHLSIGLRIQHAEYVFWLILNTIEPNYWRGWNDGERRKDREIIKVNELRNPYFQKEKKGIFGTISSP